MPKYDSIVGDVINFRGLVYAPLNENGVVFLFGKIMQDLNMYVEEIKPGFPDCIARRFTGRGWERVRVEFEYTSSNFKAHGHDPTGCDLVVCWEHDWKACPVPVIELKAEIALLPNPPIKRPTTTVEDGGGEEALQALCHQERVRDDVLAWYREIEKQLRDWNPAIWTKVTKRYVGLFSPEKSFASLTPRPTSLQIECFSRGLPLPNTKVSNARFSPRWARLSVKSAEQVALAVRILKESHGRLKAAMNAGEATHYFSGGVKPETPAAPTEVDEA